MSSVDGKGSVMNYNAEIETNRNALKRLMAVLFALCCGLLELARRSDQVGEHQA